MVKWFEDKFERERLREYTKKRLKKNSAEKFFRKFSITNWIIILNLIVFILLIILIQVFKSEKVLELFALQANNFFAGEYWTLLTSMFMHLEFWHFFANMISLFFIGNLLERIIGRKRMFWLYIISGIFAGFFYVLLSRYFGASIIGTRIFGDPSTFAIGASGAIFSLLGLLAVLTPNNKVYLITGPIIALILQAVLDNILKNSGIISLIDLIISLYILFAIFSIFSFNPKIIRLSIPVRMSFWVLPIVAILPLVIIGLFIPLPIGNSAHFGGLLMGLAYGFYLRNKYKNKIALINRIFLKI